MSVLTPEQINEYHEKGFLLVKNFIPRETVATIKKESIEAHQKCVDGEHTLGITWEHLPDHPEKKIRQLMRSEIYCENIGKLITEKKIDEACSEILGGNQLQLFHSKLMFKSATVGTFTPWHSDWGYWRTTFTEPTQMNCFLAIDPSTLENGCIRYVPGSHKEYQEHSNFESRSGFSVGLPGELDDFEATPIEMEPGDVTFHGSITVHGSGPNESSDSRIMNTFAYETVNTRINKQENKERA